MTLSKRNFLTYGGIAPLSYIVGSSAKADPTLPEVVIEAPQPFLEVDPYTAFFQASPRSPMHSDQMKMMLYTQGLIDNGLYFDNWLLSCLAKNYSEILKEVNNGAAVLVNANKPPLSYEVVSANEVQLQEIIVSASPTFAQSVTELYGRVMERSPFLPFGGLMLFASGAGAALPNGTLVMRIENLGLKPKLENIGDATNGNKLIDFINLHKDIPGVHQYNADKFGYDTGNDGYRIRFTLGNVTGVADGRLSVGGDGSWDFNGNFSLKPDIYDGGGSRPHRNPVDNAMTHVLDTISGANYRIEIEGSIPIRYTGK